MVRILCSVSGTWPEARPTALRFSICAASIFFCTWRVKQNRNGSKTSNTIARPRFWNQITTRILMILHASANMLMMPEENRVSTVSTSPTKRETSVPGSCFVMLSAVRCVNLSIKLLRSAWVIFWPNTTSRLSRADSVNPVSASMAKYSRIRANAASVPAVMESTISAKISGGISANTTAPITAETMPRERPFCFFTVSKITVLTCFLRVMFGTSVLCGMDLRCIQAFVFGDDFQQLFVCAGHGLAVFHPDHAVHLREEV